MIIVRWTKPSSDRHQRETPRTLPHSNLSPAHADDLHLATPPFCPLRKTQKDSHPQRQYQTGQSQPHEHQRPPAAAKPTPPLLFNPQKTAHRATLRDAMPSSSAHPLFPFEAYQRNMILPISDRARRGFAYAYDDRQPEGDGARTTGYVGPAGSEAVDTRIPAAFGAARGVDGGAGARNARRR
jgi:hypothetical protein